MKVGELFVALGFDVDNTKLKGFNDGVQSSIQMLSKMASIASATLFTVRQFDNAVGRAVALKNFSDQTGVATDEIQRFYNVAGRLNSNITLDQVIGSFTKLSEVIADAKMGKGPFGVAAQLGIGNLGAMDEMGVVNALRANFAQNVTQWGRGDEQVVIDMMSQLGIGPELIRTIKATDEEFKELWNNPILSEENITRLSKVSAAKKELSYQFQVMRDTLAAEISPSAIEFFKNLSTVMEKIPAIFQKVRGEFDALGTPLKAITTGLAAAGAAAVALAAPFGGIILGVGLLLAALNDLGRYFRGESSLTGEGIQGAMNMFDKIKGTISAELAKTPEQHRLDRERILKSGTPGQSVGPQSYQTNHINVYGGDARETALATFNEIQARSNRQTQANLGVNASGMFA